MSDFGSVVSVEGEMVSEQKQVVEAMESMRLDSPFRLAAGGALTGGSNLEKSFSDGGLCENKAIENQELDKADMKDK